MPRFNTVQFMSAEERTRVFKDWKRFLIPLALDDPGPGIYEAFTNRLYHHLNQHCSFIAHYNRNGFYQTYFADPENTPQFLQQFDKDKGHVSWEYRSTYWLDGDYSDINRAMCGAFESAKVDIYAALHHRAVRRREGELERLKNELEKMKEQ